MESPDVLLDMIGRFAQDKRGDHSLSKRSTMITSSSQRTPTQTRQSSVNTPAASAAPDAFARSPPIDVYIASNDDEHRLEQQSFLEDEDTFDPLSVVAATRSRHALAPRRLTGEELLRQRWGLAPRTAPSLHSHQGPDDELTPPPKREDPSVGFHSTIEAVRAAMSDVRSRPSVRQILNGNATLASWNVNLPSSSESDLKVTSAVASSAPASTIRASVRDGADRMYLRTLKDLHVDDMFYAIREKELASEATGVRLHESDLALLPMSVIRYRMRCAALWRRRGHGTAGHHGASSQPLTFPTPPSIVNSQKSVSSLVPTSRASSRSASMKVVTAGEASSS